MRSAAPGMYEHELDAVAKFVFYRNGAQGDAYYSLIAQRPGTPGIRTTTRASGRCAMATSC